MRLLSFPEVVPGLIDLSHRSRRCSVGLKAGSKEREKERQTVGQTEEARTTGTENRVFRGLATGKSLTTPGTTIRLIYRGLR